MAKRFTDTDKWKKPMLRAMPAAYKLLWLYICDDCDHAGIWQVDMDVAQLRTGEVLDKPEAEKLFSDKITVFDNGAKWFIPGFIEFQYGELNQQNRAHQSVLKILNKYGLLEKSEKIKPLTSPLQGAKDKDMVKEKDMDKEQVQEEEGVGEEGEAHLNDTLLVPKMMTIWKQACKLYPIDLGKDYPALQSIARFLFAQEKINYNVSNSDSIGQILTIWQGLSSYIVSHDFFRKYSLYQVDKHIQAIIQDYQNGKSDSGNKQPTGGQVSTSSAFAKIDLMFAQTGSAGDKASG